MNKQSKLSIKSCCSLGSFILANYFIVNTLYFLLNDNITAGFRLVCSAFSNLEIKFYKYSTFLFLALKCYFKALISCDIENMRFIRQMTGTPIFRHFFQNFCTPP